MSILLSLCRKDSQFESVFPRGYYLLLLREIHLQNFSFKQAKGWDLEEGEIV